MEKILYRTPSPTALVTGASSGIGLHFARQLAEEGCNVLLVSNQENEIKQAAAGIASEFRYADRSNTAVTDRTRGEMIIPVLRKPQAGAPGPSGRWVMGIYQNLALPEAAEHLADYCREAGIEIDILINNAGIFFFNDLLSVSETKTDTMLSLHTAAVTRLCRLFGAQMKERGRGYILNMSSISAHTPFPGISLYAATKAYVRTFTLAFHYELKEYGVRVLAVCPGAVATDLYRLPVRLQRLGVNLGIIYKPDRMVRKALRRLRSGKRIFIPGLLNRLFGPVFSLLPGFLILQLRRWTGSLMK